jgi:hypothetical protein
LYCSWARLSSCGYGCHWCILIIIPQKLEPKKISYNHQPWKWLLCVNSPWFTYSSLMIFLCCMVYNFNNPLWAMGSILVLETCLKTYILHNPKLGGVVEWAAECPWFHEPSQRKWMHHLRVISFFTEQWCLCSHKTLLCQILYCQFLSCRIQWKVYFASTLPTSFIEHPVEVFQIIYSFGGGILIITYMTLFTSIQEATINKSIVLNITLANPHSENIQSRYK